MKSSTATDFQFTLRNNEASSEIRKFKDISEAYCPTPSHRGMSGLLDFEISIFWQIRVDLIVATPVDLWDICLTSILTFLCSGNKCYYFLIMFHGIFALLKINNFTNILHLPCIRAIGFSFNLGWYWYSRYRVTKTQCTRVFPITLRPANTKKSRGK